MTHKTVRTKVIKMPECMTCQTTEDLSIKSTLPSGLIRFICKTCRREAYHKYKLTRPTTNTNKQKITKANWNSIARETIERLSVKYG